jgi:hypothetical protein
MSAGPEESPDRVGLADFKVRVVIVGVGSTPLYSKFK